MIYLILVQNAKPNLVNSSLITPSKSQVPLTYQTWAVYLLSFLRTLYQSLFGLALPNYLIFQQIMEEEIIGIIIGTTSLIYIVTPFLGQYIGEKIGTRKTLVISTSLSAISLLMQVTFFQFGAILIITMQILEGIALGCFWPNLMNRVSIWQKFSTNTQSHKNFRTFNLSWNMGILGGFISGFLIVEIYHNDFIAMIVSAGLVLILIPIALLIEDDHHFTQYQSMLDNNRVLTESHQTDNNQNQQEKENLSLFPHLIFPAFIAWVLNFYYSMGKSIYNFNLPFNLLQNEIKSSWRYLITFLQQLLQIFGLNYIASHSIKFKDRIIKVMLALNLISAIIMAFTSNIYIIIIGVIILGLSTGFQQGIVMRINFDHSSAKNERKYITIGEIVAGIGFGITPLWMGWLVTINYHYSYWIFTGMSIGMICFYCICMMLKKRKQKS